MFNVSFNGKREDKNTIEQLKNNGTALTLNNQRNISTAIDNLSEDPSEANIKFLMNVAQGLRYGVSFDLDNKKSNNDWENKLKTATNSLIEKTDSPNKEALKAQFKEVFVDKKEPTEDEKAVLNLRANLLKTKGLPQAMQASKNDAVKNIAKNLDYFVVSSEVTTEEKKSCLEKLNKLMSPNYNINPQLKDRKPQVLGELLNDLVVKTADSDMPTIKTTDQRHHGMCAAISISRKAMAYEYKSKFVEQVMNELDSKKEMPVYDITKIGSNKKVNVPKTEIDFDYADDKGYRILDASALQWMNIAGTTGKGDNVATHFSAFDREFFDTFHDSHLMRDLDDPKLVPHQYELRALEKAEENINSASKGITRRTAQALEQKQTERFNAQTVAKANAALSKNFKTLMGEKSDNEIQSTVNEFLKLNQDKGSKFYIVDAEEEVTKKEKMAKFIEDKNPKVNKELMNEKMDDIFNMWSLSTETSEYMSKDFMPKTPEDKMKKHYQPLYNAAASYRTAVDKKLDVPENLDKELKKYNLKPEDGKKAVMTQYEKEGKVVSEPILRSLQDKYNKLAKYGAVVEKAEIKGEKPKLPPVALDENEIKVLDEVAKNLKKMGAEVKRDRMAKEKMLEKPLNDLYKEVGQEQGHFWVGKEGSSGLNTPQMVRIFEQMTGEYHYTEKNIDVVAQKIKKGPHSGVSSTSVYHNEMGGHAQYIADVAPLLVKDSKTGKFEVKDAIMHDNTWGACEHKNTWLDSKGLLRTDYQCGRGGQDGYITNKAWQNGTLIEAYKTQPGAILKSDGSVEKFKQFWDATLVSKTSHAKEPAKQFNQTVFMGPEIKMSQLAGIMQAVKDVPVENLDKVMDRAMNAGETAGSYEALINKSIDNIHSEADYNKLPDNHPLKSMMQTVAAQMTISKDTAQQTFAMTIKNTDVESVDIDGSVDENFVVVKNWIDKTYNPDSNKEFVAKFNELKALPDEALADVILSVKDEDLGIKEVSEYDCVKNLQNLDEETESILSQNINLKAIQDNIEFTAEGNSFEEQLFIFNRDFSSLELGDQIKSMKGEMFAKHGVRAAFPETKLITDEDSKELAKTMTSTLAEGVSVVSVLKAMKAGEIDKQGLSDEQIDTAMKNQLADINQGKKVFIEANIDPKARVKVGESLNKYLSATIKGDEKAQEKAYGEFENDFTRYHILKKPKALLKEFIKLSRTENPEKKEMAQIYEGYMVNACKKLSGFEFEYAMQNTAGEGHLHKVGQELLNTRVIDPYADEKAPKGAKLSTDKGLISFINRSFEMVEPDKSAKFFNQTGLSANAMRAEARNLDLEGIKPLLNQETLPIVAESISNEATFVENLNLSKSPKEAKLQEEYLAKIDNFVEYINQNVEKIMNTPAIKDGEVQT